MRGIKISKTELVALVDDDMYEELSKVKWHLHTNGYANNSTLGYMHRYINNTPKGLQTDHVNGDKLDNRKSNLRTCTKSQNQMNIKRSEDSTVKYRGVTCDRRKLDKQFQARIRIEKVQVHLGYFRTPEDAAQAYNVAALEHHGEFAIINKTV